MNSLKKLITIPLRDQWKFNFIYCKRLFYSPSSLGIDSFISRREKICKSTDENFYEFKKRIQDTCNGEKNVLVFSSDLLKMIYMAKDKKDLEIIHCLLRKLASQKLIKVQKYKLGPEILRLYHHMNLPLEAMALVEEKTLYSEFDSVTSFTLLLDMLFENNLYEEVIRMYNYRLNHNNVTLNASLNLIYFGACYKLNTKNSFEEAFKLWQDFSNTGFQPGIRLRLFFAALSLNQNQNFCAMEVLPLIKFETLSENIKCLILAKSQRLNDALESLRRILNNEKEKVFVLKEIIAAVEKEVSNSSEEMIVLFQNTKDDLLNKNKINDSTLDACLCANLQYKFKRS